VDPSDDLAQVTAHLQPLLSRHGFRQRGVDAGWGSGGPSAETTFVRRPSVWRRLVGKEPTAERTLGIWVRGTSLAVGYSVGDVGLDHARYMRELLGPAGGNHFPAFAEDVERSCEALLYDLEHFCSDFLAGDAAEFLRCATAAEAAEGLSGFQRLARTEHELPAD